MADYGDGFEAGYEEGKKVENDEQSGASIPSIWGIMFLISYSLVQ